MGLINSVLGNPKAVTGLGRAISDVASVFAPNATREMELGHKTFGEVIAQFGEEYKTEGKGKFDRFVNGLNRLPRPALALGTLGLFGYAMVAPEGFSERMQGLAYVPEPLWWLLGAIVSFYFGAREMHHIRKKQERVEKRRKADKPPAGNPALSDWRGER